jgi:short-subunit dehydrogenase
MQLSDRTVWLIGASTGIGAAVAPRLAREGARLAISSRNEEALRRVANGIPGDVIVRPLDATVEGALESAADALRAQWGHIDVMIYNAGVWSAIDVENYDVKAIEEQIAVNFVGLARAVGAVLPHMIVRCSGEIVGVASLSGYGAFPRAEAYGASKAAANYFLQSLRLDVAKHNIGVTTVNPGFVKTRLTDVNDFPMPFLMEPVAAAEAIVEGLLAGHTEIHFPKRLSVPLKLVTALPRPVYEFLLSRTTK